MRKLLIVCLAACLLLTQLMVPAGAAEAPEGFSLYAANGKLALYGNPETGDIILESLADGYRWYSNPQENDRKAKGIHRQTLMSQVAVTYSNERGTALQLSSAGDSVRDGGMLMAQAGEGITVTYDFPKAGIRLKMEYLLGEDHLEVQVPVNGIVAYPDAEGKANLNTVTSVDVLPVFGAGSMDDEGYMLVPDGSGALIHFNNGDASMVEYNALLYGKDHGVEGQIAQTGPAQAQTQEQVARMPVFGIHHKGGTNQGMLAVITQNDAKARVLARVSNLTSYNYVYSRFMLRTGGSMVMSSKEFGTSVIGVGEREGLTQGTYAVRYYPLSGDQASYAGMAARYRRYLENEMGLTSSVSQGEYPLFVDTYGYVKKAAQRLGIPYTKTVPLTTTQDLGMMLDAFHVEQTVVRYVNWMPNTAYEKIPSKAGLLGALGQMQDLNAIGERLESQGGALYPAADLVQVYKPGNGFWAIRDAVLTPVNTPQLQYQYLYGSRTINPQIQPWYLLSPAKYNHFYQRFFDSFAKTGLSSLALPGIADVCTSDNRSGGTGRGDVPGLVRDVLSNAPAKLMLDGGNMYAAVMARHLAQAPATSSGYSITDETVPFYQMVLHGFVPYSMGLMNHAAQPRQLMLRLLEYGASPQYALIGRNLEEVADSRMVWLLSPDYRVWAEGIRAVYEELKAVLGPVAHLPITGHQNFAGGGSVTIYGDQTAVYVNNTQQDLVLDDSLVPAQGYLVMEVE